VIISNRRGRCRSHRLMSPRSHQLPILLRRAALQPTTRRRLLSTVSATRRAQCPKCHSTLPTPLPACPKCSYISRVPSNIRYHEMFDLPSVDNPFKIDGKRLTHQFRKLQQTIHPDAWSAKGEVRVRWTQSRTFRSDLGPRTRDRRNYLLLQTCLRW